MSKKLESCHFASPSMTHCVMDKIHLPREMPPNGESAERITALPRIHPAAYRLWWPHDATHQSRFENRNGSLQNTGCRLKCGYPVRKVSF
jgi:hypothetical protein